MYYVYILQSLIDSRTYIGYTDNLERRIKQHNSRKSKSTKYRAPFKLLFNEEFDNISEAKQRELWWKSGIGRKRLAEYFSNLATT